MSSQSIEITIDKRNIVTLTLNRPEVHNAVSLEMIRELRKIIAELNSDPEPRGVILTGAGQTFCAGMDLRWMQKISTQNRAKRISEATELSEMLNELDQLNKPLIGKINGNSFGGAIGLISCCDYALAIEDAEFSLTEVLLGLLPATISPFVIRKIGASNARRIMLNAHRFSAKEAVSFGLVSKAVSIQSLEEEIDNETNELLRCSPEAVSSTKNLISEVRGREPHAIREYTIEKLADAWETESVKKGIEAFFSKRSSKWS
ncbi:MAG: enoyl-CoA hydratase [Deltaproteobacteria bacterium]|nr:enoyl-CoA hydratase [Deltaproteobacteria bacterium]